MNAYIASNDSLLINRVRNIPGVDTMFPIREVGDIKAEGSSFLVFSDQLIEPDGLPDIRERFSSEVIIYLVSNESRYLLEQIRTICQTYSIDVIMPGSTVDDIIQFIEERAFNRKQTATSVVAFLSGLPQQGLTSTLLAMANQMGTMSDAKIGVIGLNVYNPGVDLLPYKGKTFDDIWGNLQSKTLSADELYEKCHRLSGNVYYLGGNKNIRKSPYYEVEGVHFLIEQARKSFDLVLLDIGAYFDTPLAAQGLMQADLQILLMTQLETHIHAFEEKYKQILSVMGRSRKEQMLLLLNQVRDLPGYYDPKDVSSLLNIPTWVKLPYEEMFYQRIVNKTLESFVSIKYDEALKLAAQSILKRYSLPIQDQEKARSKWLSIFGKKQVGVKV